MSLSGRSSKLVKLVIYVPKAHADKIRQVLGQAGAGKIGHYSHCTFSVTGTGRFLPLKGAHPTIGEVGKLEEVIEERIETICFRKDLPEILKAVKQTHPYESPAIDIYPLLSD